MYFLFGFFFVFVLSNITYATPIVTNLQGTIIENKSSDNRFDEGVKYTGYISYDPDLMSDFVPGDPNFSAFEYNLPNYMNMELVFSSGISIHASWDENALSPMSLSITNGDVDRFTFRMNMAVLGEYPYEGRCSLSLELYDSTGLSFDDDLLPGLINFHNFDSESLYINSSLFKADIIPSPEPGTLMLLLSGFLYSFRFMNKKRS